MKELLDIRVDPIYAWLLYKRSERENLGGIYKVVIDTSQPIYRRTEKAYKILRKLGLYLFYGWGLERIYGEKELQAARFLQILPKLFTLSGEECGTQYDESFACPICGAGGKMIPPLKIHRSRIPKTDISMTLGAGEEILVSERFRQIMEDNHVTGIRYEPVYSGHKQIDYFQLLPEHYIELSDKTLFGISPFDLSGESKPFNIQHKNPDGKIWVEHVPLTVYKCPNGDNLGLNILSEAYIKYSSVLNGLDYFASRQTVGHKGKGLIRPKHLIFCSNRMMRIIKENRLKGFKFEVAHIVDE